MREGRQDSNAAPTPQTPQNSHGAHRPSPERAGGLLVSANEIAKFMRLRDSTISYQTCQTGPVVGGNSLYGYRVPFLRSPRPMDSNFEVHPQNESAKVAAYKEGLVKVYWVFLVSVFIGLVSSPEAAYSLPPPPPPAHMLAAPGITPSNIVSGNQYYDAGITGLSDYMGDLKNKNSKVHAELESDLASLRSQRLWSYLVPAALTVGGIGLVFAGASSGSPSTPLMAISALALVAAVPAYWILAPGRSDILKFINKHNQLLPSSPLKLNIGLNQGVPFYSAQLAWRF
jgi:hypothetical protein